MDLPRGGGLEIACDNISIFPASPPGQRYNKSVLRVAAGYKMPVSTHPQAGRTLLAAYMPILPQRWNAATWEDFGHGGGSSDVRKQMRDAQLFQG